MAVMKMMAGTDKTDDQLKSKDFASLANLPTSLRCAYVEYSVNANPTKEQGAIDCYAYLEYYSKNNHSLT